MLAILLSIEYDPLGVVELDVLPPSAFQERRRRLNRIATLDGGAAFNDFGFSDADMTFALLWQVTDRPTEEAVQRMVRDYGQINIAIDDAMYRVGIEVYTPGATESTMRLLVAEKLTT